MGTAGFGLSYMDTPGGLARRWWPARGRCLPSRPDFPLRRKRQVQRLAAATVKILARASDSTISVSWLDATACRYDDQIWRIGVARHSGICGLARATVRAGNHIYRPIRIRPPVNSNFMILAAVVEQVWITARQVCGPGNSSQ
ncbi:DUF3331 domain-containing protein [Paraburkholderia sp. SIMBA_030]|uniref:DUF3331 domain-containing protein n=1 Tax=Paraburkholderia sp. SIMBA_030 TaxID=3085773 RepID=UPI00397BB46C